MATETEIIFISVYHAGSSKDMIWAKKRDQLVFSEILGSFIITRLHVSKITDVTFLHIWTTMFLAKWVVVRAGGGASIGQVTELMDVESVEAFGQSLELSCDLAFFSFCLFESYDSKGFLTLFWVKYTDGLSCLFGSCFHIKLLIQLLNVLHNFVPQPQ